ncbi:MAG: hypothetical protein D6691_06760 [Candidatus Hydrogenedentota bacterium]|nr:MAG: hypothetical protein D6691_06760 [Candidatus Hydrogenedentota bacterium]GIX44873.1 MAG: hypothetical protein KatS3mg130_1281 [Candidatus Sumerlaea sp.]
MDYEQLLIFNELSEIIRWHNQCLDRMKGFREKYPYLVPPNVAKMVEENLKENVQVLYRELNHIHKPKTEKQRYVCRECHSVFYVKLPNGLCDECRAKQPSAVRPTYGKVRRRVNLGPDEVEPAAESPQPPEAQEGTVEVTEEKESGLAEVGSASQTEERAEEAAPPELEPKEDD